MTDAEKLIYDAVKEVNRQVAELNTKVTEASTQLESILGNGQPGRLQYLEQTVAEDHDTLTKIKGAIAVIYAAVTLFAGAVIKYVFGRHG
jgi:hypothetical protein